MQAGMKGDGMKNFSKKTFYLNPSEYAKIVSEINTNYSKYKGKWFSIHFSYSFEGTPYWYYFENRGFDDYNIYARIER